MSRSAALEGKLNRDGKGEGDCDRRSLAPCVTVPLPCPAAITRQGGHGDNARAHGCRTLTQHMALIGPHEQGLRRPLLTPRILLYPARRASLVLKRERGGEDPFILLKSGVCFATFRAIPQIRPDMSFPPLPLTPPSLDNIGTRHGQRAALTYVCRYYSTIMVPPIPNQCCEKLALGDPTKMCEKGLFWVQNTLHFKAS